MQNSREYYYTIGSFDLCGFGTTMTQPLNSFSEF